MQTQTVDAREFLGNYSNPPPNMTRYEQFCATFDFTKKIPNFFFLEIHGLEATITITILTIPREMVILDLFMIQ